MKVKTPVANLYKDGKPGIPCFTGTFDEKEAVCLFTDRHLAIKFAEAANRQNTEEGEWNFGEVGEEFQRELRGWIESEPGLLVAIDPTHDGSTEPEAFVLGQDILDALERGDHSFSQP